MRPTHAFITGTAATLAAMTLLITPATAQTRSPQLVRGEYIVTHVAMCAQCHSPRNEAGDIIQGQWLQGAKMPVASPYPVTPFAVSAPKLAGLPAGWHEEQLADLLMNGRDFRGRVPRPPMPPFRMNEEDAKAVAAYLRSLK